MESYALEQLGGTRDLVSAAHRSDEPVIVFDGEDECLVAMCPSVFDRILYDSDLLNCEDRSSFHL